MAPAAVGEFKAFHLCIAKTAAAEANDRPLDCSGDVDEHLLRRRRMQRGSLLSKISAPCFSFFLDGSPAILSKLSPLHQNAIAMRTFVVSSLLVFPTAREKNLLN
jgi:hypothetical protein